MLSLVQFFTLPRQLILFFASLALTIFFHVMWGWSGFAGSWLTIIIMGGLLAKHLLIGTVNAAAMKMQMGDWEGAEKVLKYTWKPSWLRFGYHGMFYILKSQIAFQKKDFNEAEKFANMALALDLPDDFAGMVYLELMAIYGQRKNQMKVKEYLQQAKKLNISNPQIKEQIHEVDQMLKGVITPQQRKFMGKQRTLLNQGYMRRNPGRK